jgi:hypothetical protein
MHAAYHAEADALRQEPVLSPRRLVSLLAMIRFWAHHVMQGIDDLSRWIRILSQKPGADPITTEDAQELEISLTALNLALDFMGNTGGRDQLQRLIIDVSWPLKQPKTGYKPKSNETIKSFLERARIAVYNELELHKFAYVPEALQGYFENEKLFGEPVYDNFKSARDDIKETGNCLAAELHTASVFHLMRVAERGIRALAYDRRVKFDKGPIESQDWQAIIGQLQKEIEKVSNWPKSKQRAQAEEFYNSALEEFRGFKGAWRNHVMHARRSYNDRDALSVLSHVQRFMQLLATRISEGERMPLRWTKKQILPEA